MVRRGEYSLSFSFLLVAIQSEVYYNSIIIPNTYLVVLLEYKGESVKERLYMSKPCLYNEKKTEQVQIRITPTMKATLREMASNQNRTISNFIDNIILEYIQQKQQNDKED